MPLLGPFGGDMATAASIHHQGIAQFITFYLLIHESERQPHELTQAESL
jgi:hypothetical protein